MLELTKEEFEALRLKIETSKQPGNPLRLQNETLKTGRRQHAKYLPYTWQCVAILSGVLNGKKTINLPFQLLGRPVALCGFG
jgi:hypothetical protein